MKIINTLISLVLLISVNSLLAQETFSYNYISPIEVAVAIGGEEEYSATVENLTDGELILTWFIEDVDFPEDWSVFVCDNGACWPPSFITRNFTLTTGEVSSLKTTILTQGIEGCGSANIRVHNNVNGEEITHTILLCTSPVGVEDVQAQAEESVQIYPNPLAAGSSLQVTIPMLFASTVVMQTNIYNQLGQLVYQQTQNNGSTISIPTSQWAAGIYFVEVKAGELLQVQKIQIR